MNKKSFTQLAINLKTCIDKASPQLRSLPPEMAKTSRGKGKWTRIEILGHLIDSAANNHHRFVRAQEKSEELIFPGYDQNLWVRSQAYSESSWEGIMTLWESYNHHLVKVIEGISENLQRLQCKIGDDPRTSLYELIDDYIAHIEHHLKQVLGSN